MTQESLDIFDFVIPALRGDLGRRGMAGVCGSRSRVKPGMTGGEIKTGDLL